jgi:hypothetical protein
MLPQGESRSALGRVGHWRGAGQARGPFIPRLQAGAFCPCSVTAVAFLLQQVKQAVDGHGNRFVDIRLNLLAGGVLSRAGQGTAVTAAIAAL